MTTRQTGGHQAPPGPPPSNPPSGGSSCVKPPAVDASRAIELAYGLLWRCATDLQTGDGMRIHLARVALLGQLDQAGQARGIDLAQKLAQAARPPESRKNPRTADAAFGKYLQALSEPRSE